MSSKVAASKFESGYSAYNNRKDEDVYLVSKCGEEHSGVWIVEGKDGLYLEYESNLESPFYYGD